jgi:uncharacterized 2Fe-2S/4Fe-4S cluster protein (DUF4445 family)
MEEKAAYSRAPPLPPDLDRKVRHVILDAYLTDVGNAAGTGARLALISKPQRRRAAEIAGRVRYIELARAPRFIGNFAEGMMLSIPPS